MELTVLGCWAPYPRAGGACSGYLIRDGGVNVLLEAGNGALSRMMEHIDFCALDAVVVTHFHPDHYLDLFPLRHALEGARREGKRADPLPLYAPAEPAEVFAKIAGYDRAFAAVPVESLPGERVKEGLTVRRAAIGGLGFQFAPARHPLPAYSVSVTGTGRLVYSGDTARTPALAAFAAGAGLFLCEASGMDGDAEYLADSHLTAREAGELAREAGVRRLIITHFWPGYDPLELSRLAAAGFGKDVEAAREGETYELYDEAR
ncbi:MAG: MBL fold metallo-hydrolase [Firmicutes bacterium]|nr:MBL fold metallo-hydrolase [Bacillota bacterium]